MACLVSALALTNGPTLAQPPLPCGAADAAAAKDLLSQAQAWRDRSGKLPCHDIANANVIAPPAGQEPRTSSQWEWNAGLYAIALDQAKSLAQRGVLEHLDAEGRGLAARAGQRAYEFRLLAENLGRGTQSVDDALRAWEQSLKHCVHVANERYTEAALACARGRDGPYWVMVFGRR